MSSEIKAFGLTAGLTYKAVVLNAAGQYWTGTGNNFAAASGITWSAAGVTMTPDGTITRDFVGSFPATITSAGTYSIKVYQQVGGTLVASDIQGTPVALGMIGWDGTAEITAAAGNWATNVIHMASSALADFFLTSSGTGGLDSAVAGSVVYEIGTNLSVGQGNLYTLIQTTTNTLGKQLTALGSEL